MRVFKSIAGCLFGMVFVLGVAQAQQFTGRVTDASGAVVSKAQITITNVDTNVAETSVTTGTGDYTVPYLKPGHYSITIMAPGFDTQTKTDLTLQVSQTLTVNFTLKVGTVSETIQVNEAQLDRGKADVGEVVENERVNELPLNGGDMGQLAQLSAGTYYSGSVLYMRPFDNSVAALSINGGGAANNQLLLDGVSNEAAHGDAYNGTNSQMGYIAPVQSVQEFKVVTNPYDAQYGRAQGGAIDMTLKSGTNALHGSVYEFARRGWLDSNLWVNDYNNLPKQNHKRDQYGFELDGPVVLPKVYNGQNKTFFLAQFENWSEIIPSVALDSVPEQQWLTGDFSDLSYYDASLGRRQPITLYDPLTLHNNGTGALVRDPFPGNIIPQNRLSPFAAKLYSYYPKPNATPGATQNSYTDNYVGNSAVTDTYRNALFKIDQTFSSKDRGSLRWGYWERDEYQDQNGIPGVGANGEFPHGERVNTFVPDWIHTFTPNLIVDFKASVIVRGNILNSGPLNYDLTQLGLPTSFISSLGVFGNFLPSTNSGEFTQIGNSGGQFTVGNSLAMLPTLTWVKGKHTVHAGFDWRLLQSSWRTITGGTSLSVDRTWTQANYQSGDAASGNSIASLLLGTASSGYVSINPLAFYSQHYYAPFVQDDWKILPNLTLNLGFRYDINGDVVERHNRMDYIFNTTVTNPVQSQVPASPYLTGPLMGGQEFVGVNGNPRPFNQLDKGDWQPRAGFSWSVHPKTVVHGGFGVMFQNPNPGPSQYGFSSTTQYNPSNDGMKTPTQNLGVGGTGPNPFPTVIQPTGSSLGLLTGLGQGLFYLNPTFKVPRTFTYSAGVQQQFAADDIVEINYVGTRTNRLGTSDNINHPAESAYAQCNLELGGNPAVCNSDTGSYLTNPFQGVAPFQGSNYYSQPTIQALNFTRPFQAFGDITEYDINGGKTWYNALQVTGSHRVSKSLTVHGTWTWSKTMDAGGFTDTIYRIKSRHLDSSDFAHRITFSGFWMIPVGRGRTFLGHANRLVDAALGGWETSTIISWQTGMPWQLNGSTYMYGSAHIQPQYSSNLIRGVNNACVGQWQQNSTTGQWRLASVGSSNSCGGNYNFVVAPQYGDAPNINYTGIRNPRTSDMDASLAKTFGIVDRLHAQFRVDAFNLPNHPDWATGYDYTPTDANFGTIIKSSAGQSNQPRNVQLTFKVIW
ncbi:TonB-dependent receptor [Acidicapsa ligni]|uniref:TonB-dependent receptor n=1 Tax=Acidicapsa ligni TaxID=542300 RepID=UPI0021DFEFC8|nr:TonB-dependent receptor [Acidicapsa ligni]